MNTDGKDQNLNDEEEDETGNEFFDWLTRTHEEASDEIADIIKDDLWSNPYQVEHANKKNILKFYSSTTLGPATRMMKRWMKN